MKIKKIILIALIFFPVFSFAQQMQDVIYLKDGGVLKGTIIEEVPGKTYKIESTGGNIFAVTLDEIEKLAKKKTKSKDEFWFRSRWRNDTTFYQRKNKGHFFEAQLLVENRQFGGRIINGYRFSNYAQLGIGIGIDMLMSSPFNEPINGLNKKALAGTYPSVFLYFQSEAKSRRRVSPYFALEGGYTMAFGGLDETAEDEFGNTMSGGIMAGAGLGLRIKPRRKMPHVSILFNFNYKQINYTQFDREIGSTGTAERVEEEGIGHILVPGIRLGIGF
jgi:hypothetical protein